MADILSDHQKIDIPSWVPLSVKRMASFFGFAGFGGGIRRRLVTDLRMEKVWRVLQSSEVSKSGLDSVHHSLQRLRDWDIPEYDLSLRDRACAAFFFNAEMELGDPRPVYTRAELEVSAKQCLVTAELCRSAAHHGIVPLTPKLSEALSIVGKHFQDLARMEAQRASPYIIERSRGTRGDDEIRVRGRALATETRRLFGSFLYGTVATVVTVGLEIEPAITAKSVENWCSGLPSQ